MSKNTSNKILQSSSVFALIGLSLFSFSAIAMESPEEDHTFIQRFAASAKLSVEPPEWGRICTRGLVNIVENMVEKVVVTLGGYSPKETTQATANSLNPAMQEPWNRPVPNLPILLHQMPEFRWGTPLYKIPEFRWGDQSQVNFWASADRNELDVKLIGDGSCSAHYKNISPRIELAGEEKIKISFGLNLEQGKLKYIFLDHENRKLPYKTSVSKGNTYDITTLKVTPTTGQTRIKFIIEPSHDPKYSKYGYSVFTLENLQIFKKRMNNNR